MWFQRVGDLWFSLPKGFWDIESLWGVYVWKSSSWEDIITGMCWEYQLGWVIIKCIQDWFVVRCMNLTYDNKCKLSWDGENIGCSCPLMDSLNTIWDTGK